MIKIAKQFLQIFFLILLVSLVLVSCNPEDKAEIEKSASAFDIQQGKASISQANLHFRKSFKSADSSEASTIYSNDAKLMPSGREPIAGKDQIISYLSSMINGGLSDFEFETLNIWGDSSILVEEGTYSIEDSLGSKVDHGKYIALWKPESGNWKIFRDIWTSNIPRVDSVLENSQSPKKLLLRKLHLNLKK